MHVDPHRLDDAFGVVEFLDGVTIAVAASGGSDVLVRVDHDIVLALRAQFKIRSVREFRIIHASGLRSRMSFGLLARWSTCAGCFSRGSRAEGRQIHQARSNLQSQRFQARHADTGDAHVGLDDADDGSARSIDSSDELKDVLPVPNRRQIPRKVHATEGIREDFDAHNTRDTGTGRSPSVAVMAIVIGRAPTRLRCRRSESG